MIQTITLFDEEGTGGLMFFRKQILRDLESGRINQEQAVDLFGKIERVRGYANLVVALLSFSITREFLTLVMPWWLKTIISNMIISVWPLADKRARFAHLHSPGTMLIRCIPGLGIVATNIAMLRAEPDLHDVALRFCEHAYRRMHLSFLIPIFVRPSMAGIRWLNNLTWPTLQKPT